MEAGGRGKEHFAGLDGLRAVAVLSVVVFHLDDSILPGGFVGVTLFFALSGYLLTRRATTELVTVGRLDVRAFWLRRVRRLMPATVLCLLAVQVTWSLGGWGDVSSQVVGAAANVANWQMIAQSRQYGADPAASPLHHFWSLAVEEQFYWLFPVVVAAVGPRFRRLTAVFGAILALSLVWTLLWRENTGMTYLSTPSRMGEIALGAFAALALRDIRLPVRAAEVTSVALLASILVSARLVTLDHRFVYTGGLFVMGLMSAGLVAVVPSTRVVSWALDWAPLAWIGRRAFGVYLFHWPLIVLMHHVGFDVDRLPVASLIVAVTVAIAAASFSLLEEPIRRSTLVSRPVVATLCSFAVVTAAVVALPDRHGAAALRFDIADSVFRESAASTVPEVSSSHSTPGTSEGPRKTSFIMVGDSKALLLAVSASRRTSPTTEYRGGWAELGCPLARASRYRASAREGNGVALPKCEWTGHLAEASAGVGGADVAVVDFGTWDVGQVIAPCCAARWSSLDDEEFRVWFGSEVDALVAELVGAGVRRVAFATLRAAPEAERPDRVKVFNEELANAAARHPATVSIIHLAEWFDGRADVDTLLPDGMHTTIADEFGAFDSGDVVFDEFLDSAIVTAAR